MFVNTIGHSYLEVKTYIMKLTLLTLKLPQQNIINNRIQQRIDQLIRVKNVPSF